MTRPDKDGVIFLSFLLVLTILSYFIGKTVQFTNYTEIVRNSIMFITISAGFYRAGLAIIVESPYIKYENEKPNQKYSYSRLSIQSLTLLYRSATYISILSVAFLIIIEGLHNSYTNYILRHSLITILIVNIYCALKIFEILIKCVQYKK